jgi:putative copper export protein
VLYVWNGRSAIAAFWVTAALAAISALLVGGGLLGMWNSFPEPRSTGTVIRILLGALAFVLVFAAVHFAISILGIERGEWRYALAIGIGLALVHLAWKLLAPRGQPPPQSS